jgi:hypothetical protein
MFSRNEFNLADSSKIFNAENVLQNQFSLRTTAGKESGPSLLRQVYFAYVQSHILYSIVIWGGSPHLGACFCGTKESSTSKCLSPLQSR